MNLLERTDLTRSQLKRRFCRFTKTLGVNNMEPVSLQQRRAKAAEYERKHKTSGQRAKFDIADGVAEHRNSGTQRQAMRSAEAAPFGWGYSE